MEIRIAKAADRIREVCGPADVGLILGSGLGDYAEALEDGATLPYGEIPGFPTSTVRGHAGVWCGGTLHGKRVAMMRGRFHAYEGYPLQDVTLPVRVMCALGVKTLIVTNAAGGVNAAFQPGDLMLIRDHINMSGQNPLMGKNLDGYGPRFPDMTQAYDRGLQGTARAVAEREGIRLREGVYCMMSGPSFETPAEIRMIRAVGGDAVGMSTVPEVIVARHCGMRVLGISCVSNLAAGILDQPLSHQEVMETGERVKHTFRQLLDGIIAEIL